MVRLAVASGKGGTGKTTIATNIASLLSEDKDVLLVDLDVEEPNSNLFLKYSLNFSDVEAYKPEFDMDKCTYCRECMLKCQFNAIAVAPNYLKLFEELCHGCTACEYVCPHGVISPGKRTIGKIGRNFDHNPSFVEGGLNIKETVSTDLIRQVKSYCEEYAEEYDVVIYDCPPGTTCPVIESVKDTHIVVVVAEPTPFGFHDFKIMVRTLEKLKKQFVVFINKDNDLYGDLKAYCELKKIEIVGAIKYSKEIAEVYSNGDLIVNMASVRKGLNRAYSNVINLLKKDYL